MKSNRMQSLLFAIRKVIIRFRLRQSMSSIFSSVLRFVIVSCFLNVQDLESCRDIIAKVSKFVVANVSIQ